MGESNKTGKSPNIRAQLQDYPAGSLAPCEVADLFGVGLKTIYRMLERGDLVGFKVGDRWRILKVDIRTYVKEKS